METERAGSRADDLREATIAWWRGLNDPDRRGPRAELRRCNSLEEVVVTPAFHDLRRRLAGTWYGSRANVAVVKLAAVAGLLARVTAQDDVPVAQRMAELGQGQQPRVSTLRFRRLLQAREIEDVFRVFRRTISLLRDGSGVRANVTDLAASVFSWDDERTRRRWALDYFEAIETRTPKGA